MSTYNILDFGALGDGHTNDAPAIQKAIDTCSTSGGGTVLLPAGRTYLSGTLTLKSNVEFHVERGAVLQGSPNLADYTVQFVVGALSAGEKRADEDGANMLITAEYAENIAFTGAGVIDGAGRFFVADDLGYIYRMKPGRPFTFFLLGCKNVTLRDLIIRDGALWTVRFSGCEDVLVHGIRMDNDLKLPNNDGIDLDRCRNVRISDCHLVCGDDCIVLKACEETAAYGGGCENVVVSNCTLISTSSALVVGCECRAPMRNITFDNCVIQSSHRGLAIRLSEASDVENVLFSNMIVETRIFHEKWWGRGEPINVIAVPWDHARGIGRVRNIRFVNISARSENGIYIEGWTPDHMQDILLENVRLEIDKWSKWPGGQFDRRPAPDGDLPVHPTTGVYIRNAANVTLRNVEISWGQNRPEYFGEPLEICNVRGLRLDGFKGSSAHAADSNRR
jgi:polygalacturonase